jgi:hydrogenase maturation protease
VSTAADEVVVAVLGSPWRGDDGVGPAVAERLRARGIATLACDPSALLERWVGAAGVVVVDAVRSGAPPGTLHRIDATRMPLPAWGVPTSTHALGLADTVELARTLGRLPAHLVVFGVQVGATTTGAGLSPAVAAALDPLADAVAGELAHLRRARLSSPRGRPSTPDARTGDRRAPRANRS